MPDRTGPDGDGADEWLVGGGKMGRLIREKDWSQTPLGPIEEWPQSLRTTVSLCLASNFPIDLVWGPERVQIYNDGYWPITGDKHPHSMGQDFKECWFSAWDAIGEPFENAAAGRTDFLVNERMFLDRHGYLEETFFTFSFSPIRDESGGVGGLFHPVTEMTQQTLAERRLKVLRDLADHTAEAKAVAAASTSVCRVLAEHALDVPFTLLYLLDADGRHATLAGHSGLDPGSPAAPTHVDLDAPLPEGEAPAGWPLAEAARDRRPVEVDGLDRRFGVASVGPYPEPPHSALVLPLVLSGVPHTFGLLVAGVSARRALDEPYRTFYRMLQDGVTTALTNARAYEEERRRAEALAELDRAKTAFFSNVSHEFRTPLTLILGPVEDLINGASGGASGDAGGEVGPAAREQLEVVHRNSLRLLKLVNAMLDFSRIEAGRVQACYEPVDLAALTADLASVFRAAVERAGMRLVVDCPPLPEPVYVDRGMWEKIVLNLLSNAFKYTLEGEIGVRLGIVDGRARLEVRDTGVGIPAEEMPRLFERFYRVEDARGRTHEGTGIGLALVQELARLHGGGVRVESELDEGSTFAVEIPLGRAHLDPERVGAPSTLAPTATRAEAFVEEALRWLPGEEAAPESEAPQEGGAATGDGPLTGADRPILTGVEGARIVWADDNADMREYVARLLSDRFEVEAVPDGQAALEAARAHPPDLVLSDVMMPRLDGVGLLRALRAEPELREVPVVLLSARAGEEARIEGMEADADDYLTKPFSARELVARVEAQVRLARLRKETNAALREREEALRAANETLEERVEARTAQVRQLSRALTMAEQGERRRLAEVLHDDLQQTLHGAQIQAELGDAERVAAILDSAVQTARSLSHELAPPILKGQALAELFEWLAQRKREHFGLEVEHEGGDVEVADEEVRVLLYRLLRELLFNVAKHAGVDRARLRAEPSDGGVRVVVEDEGAGFDPLALDEPGSGGLGLASVRERLEAIGGRMDVASAPGEGVRIVIEVPTGAGGAG